MKASINNSLTLGNNINSFWSQLLNHKATRNTNVTRIAAPSISQSITVQRDSNGTINYDYYAKRARTQRANAVTEFFSSFFKRG